MKVVAVGILGLAFLFTAVQAQDKDKDKKPVGALPPHPLDSVFERKTEQGCRDAMLNNALYNKAFKEAMKAKREMEERYRKEPKLVSSTPAQAARVRFLEVLGGEEGKGIGEAKKDK